MPELLRNYTARYYRLRILTEFLHLTSKEADTRNCLELSKIISFKKTAGLESLISHDGTSD